MENKLSVIILTFNEEKHIARCIASVKAIASEIIVIDSYSSDATLDIAHSLGAKTYQHEFTNQADQLNWALKNCPIQSEWIFRLDADEVAIPDLAAHLIEILSDLSADVTGVTVNRRIHFLGKFIRYGGIYPISVLRLWKNGQGHCESRLMDEHIVVDGEIEHIPYDIIDDNLNNLTWWVDKHNNYASREAIEALKIKQTKESTSQKIVNVDKQASRKRWIKENIYSKLPLGLRAFFYFIYRYILKLGFLDGWQGLAFHVLQGFWYRFLVDLKVYELEQLMKNKNQTLEEVVYSEFGYKIGKTE